MKTNKSDWIGKSKVINIKLPRVSAGCPATGPCQETARNLSSCFCLGHSGDSRTQFWRRKSHSHHVRVRVLCRCCNFMRHSESGLSGSLFSTLPTNASSPYSTGAGYSHSSTIHWNTSRITTYYSGIIIAPEVNLSESTSLLEGIGSRSRQKAKNCLVKDTERL